MTQSMAVEAYHRDFGGGKERGKKNEENEGAEQRA